MKFAEHLSAHVTPEWNSQYIRYDDMKELLARAVSKAEPLVDQSEDIVREQFFIRVDEHFFQVRQTTIAYNTPSSSFSSSTARRKRPRSIRSSPRNSPSKSRTVDDMQNTDVHPIEPCDDGKR